jgi:LuxR family transcriptional regulator, maltose regulon positive regulatory protein
MLDAESLKLTLSEAYGLARLQNGPANDLKRLDALHKSNQGWVAGWILLLSHERDHRSNPVGIARKAREMVFEYFATELFLRATPVAQDLLLKTSLLPDDPVSNAVALTGITAAAAILEDLERNNCFTTRLNAAKPIYQFHPLFHAFLRERIARTLSATELRVLQSAAAKLLCEGAQYEEAATLRRCNQGAASMFPYISITSPGSRRGAATTGSPQQCCTRHSRSLTTPTRTMRAW